jgi:hypothetical protein
LQKKLPQREKSELMALIEYTLRQETDFQWSVTALLPVTSSLKASIDPKLYQQQVLATMEAGDYRRKPKRDEVQQRLTAIKSIAAKFVEYEDCTVALKIDEVLVIELIEHFNTYQDEHFAFCIILTSCLDGLDSCFADEAVDQKLRLRVLRTLFAIYRIYTDRGMDRDDGIPGLLVNNTVESDA